MNRPAAVAILHPHLRLPARVALQAQALTERGHRVKAFCWDRNGAKGDGGNAPIELVRVPVPAPAGTNKLGLYLPSVYRSLSRLIQRERVDAVHCTHLMLLPFATRLASERQAKVVYDAHEFYALDISQRMGPAARPLRAVIERFENHWVRRVDGVITVDSRGGRLARRYRARCPTVEVLFNVPDLSVVPNENVTRDLAAQHAGDRTIAYMGAVYEGKGAGQFLRVLSRIKERVPNVKLLILGEFQDDSESSLRAAAAAEGLNGNLEVLGWASYPLLLSYLEMSEVGLALHQASEPRFWEVGRGNGRKLFDYMRSGLPIVGPGFADLGRLIEEEGCGYPVETADPDAVAERVIHLLEHPEQARAMGERGRRAVAERYNWRLEQDKVASFYERVGL